MNTSRPKITRSLSVLLSLTAITYTAQLVRSDLNPHLGNSRGLSPDIVSNAGQMWSVASSADGVRVYGGSISGGMWRSDDGGDTWRQITAQEPGDDTATCVDDPVDPCSLPPLAIPYIAVSTQDPDIVFASLIGDPRSRNSRAGVYRTLNGGDTWSRVFQFTCSGGVQDRLGRVLFAPDDPTKLWVAGLCGVAYSEGDPITGEVGARNSWQLVSMPGGGGVQDIAVAYPDSPNTRRVYACAQNNIYYSQNGGRSFDLDSAARAALPQSACAGASAIAVVPGSPNLVYLTGYSGGQPFVYGATVPDPTPSDPRRRRVWPEGTQCTDPGCMGPALYFGQYSADPNISAGAWRQVGTPPRYWATPGGSGAIGVAVVSYPEALPVGSPPLYEVLYFDDSTLQVSQGEPTYDSWHRLDGDDSTLTSPNRPPAVHVDPHFVAATRGFWARLLPAAVAAGHAEWAHHQGLDRCWSGGRLFLANDGGVYHSEDCGGSWHASQNLETLATFGLAGLPQSPLPAGGPGGTLRARGPALYFGTADNEAWTSIDGGDTWVAAVGGCGDCTGYWADPLQPDMVVRNSRPNDNGNFFLRVQRSVDNQPPSLGYPGAFVDINNSGSTTEPRGIGYPPTVYTGTNKMYDPYSKAMFLEMDGLRPLVLKVPGGSSAPNGDFIEVAPVAPVTDPPPTPVPLRVWRKQSLEPGTAGWVQDGTNVDSILPAGATVIQASGGHTNPTYYVADLALADGTAAPFSEAAQPNHLFRSHRGPDGVLDGWDCIVPGRANPENARIHNGRCTNSTTTGVQRAWHFASDPYDPNIIYIVDTDGVKLSVDGGSDWQRVESLTNWLTEQGNITPACRINCAWSAYRVLELSEIEFVPDEPGVRFASGAAGVFYTTDGATGNGQSEQWHRLLDPSATNCLPNGTYFDKASNIIPHPTTPTWLRTLYVACTGRSLLKITGIPESRNFYVPETGYWVNNIFADYWREHGGLEQQGYPISAEFREVSDLDGKEYTVQYFERAVFEQHPENKPPYDVLLSQLGTFRYREKYPQGAPNQKSNKDGEFFEETGHWVGGKFLNYWKTHGGLPQQGYPLSDEFVEVSDLNGKSYTVQYFERAVFEYHPENEAPYDVLLSQLGTYRYKAKYGGK